MNPYRDSPPPRGPSVADALPIPWWCPIRRYMGIKVIRRRRLARIIRAEISFVRRYLRDMRDDQVSATAIVWGTRGSVYYILAASEAIQRGIPAGEQPMLTYPCEMGQMVTKMWRPYVCATRG